MTGWKGVAWTIGLVFFVTMASGFINAGGDLWHMSSSTWQQLVNAGIAAVLAFVINYVAPFIPRYGIGKE
jgi:hypothetical protein